MVHFILKMKTKSKLYIFGVCIYCINSMNARYVRNNVWILSGGMFVYKIFTSISELLLYIYMWLDKV